MKNILLALLIMIVFQQCSFKAKNVLMVPRLEERGVVKVYFDREGFVYPPEAHVTPHYFYLQHIRNEKRRQSNPAFATLEYAMRENDSLNQAYLRQRHGLQGVDSVRFFIRLQNILRKNLANQIQQQLQQANSKHVVVLIHGFNDPNPDAYYFSLRRSIQQFVKQPIVFVEVYWDGLTSLGSNPIVAGIWGKAQINSAKVGLGLRQLLQQIDPGVKLTLLTHSLGASVACHTLFNPQKWPKQFQEKLEEDYKSNAIATPRSSQICLAMLAPAISGTQVMDDILRTVPEKNQAGFRKIVIGYNKYDYAVSKGGLFAKSFGNTALGANAGDEVEKTEKLIKQLDPSVQCRSIDFSYMRSIDGLDKKQARQLRQKEHSILFYQQNAQFPQFLKAVFEN